MKYCLPQPNRVNLHFTKGFKSCGFCEDFLVESYEVILISFPLLDYFWGERGCDSYLVGFIGDAVLDLTNAGCLLKFLRASLFSVFLGCKFPVFVDVITKEVESFTHSRFLMGLASRSTKEIVCDFLPAVVDGLWEMSRKPSSRRSSSSSCRVVRGILVISINSLAVLCGFSTRASQMM